MFIRQLFRSYQTWIIIVLSICSLAGVGNADIASLSGFTSVAAAKAFGWQALSGASLDIHRDATPDSFYLEASGNAETKPYGGLELNTTLELSKAAAGDQVIFDVRQNGASGIWVNINGGAIYRDVPVPRGKWTHVTLDMDLSQWNHKPNVIHWPVLKTLSLYQKTMDGPGKQIAIRGLRFVVNGREVLPVQSDPADAPGWHFPEQNDRIVFLGDAQSAWAISKKTGQVLGGWNVKTREQYLKWNAGRYYEQDAKSTFKANEEEDRVTQTQFDASKQRVLLHCVNSTLSDLKIEKLYSVQNGRLIKQTSFTSSKSGLLFITSNSETSFLPSYRDRGYYQGAGFIGPLVPAPQLGERQKITQYRNSSKCMVLSQNEKGYSFAQYRYKKNGQFVWPWWTKDAEPENALFYTPTGWEMSLGTLNLTNGQTASYEEQFSIFPGTWYDFLAKVYSSLPEVQKERSRIPAPPEWLNQVKVQVDFNGLENLRQVVGSYDEGYIMVLLDPVANWADYDPDEIKQGRNGGVVREAEIKKVIEKIRALSPRIKVGLYHWYNSALAEGGIYRKHPEWFRTYDKQGNTAILFPGLATNYAGMINNRDLYQALQKQLEREMDYLHVDFINLDGANQQSNLIDWKTGGLTLDADWQRFWLDVGLNARKRNPDVLTFFNGRGNPYGALNYIEARSELRPGYWREFAGMALATEVFAGAKGRIIPLYWVSNFAQSYINYVLALGWIPHTEKTDVARYRPFVTASSEVGDGTPVNVDYSPDWKNNSDTQLESYFMRRNKGGERLLSLISHEKEAKNFTIAIKTNTLGLDQSKKLYIWGYRIANATDWKNAIPEREARRIYTVGEQIPDRITMPELLYQGSYNPDLSLTIKLNPLELYMVSISSQPAAIYAQDNLPATFRFTASHLVNIDSTITGNTIQAVVNSQCDGAKVLLTPPANTVLKEAGVDGKAVQVQLIREGDALFPVVTVAKGRHEITAEFVPSTQRSVVAAATTPDAIPVAPPAKFPVPMIPGKEETHDVNQIVNGIHILRQSTETTATPDDNIQVGMPGLSASADAGTLTLEAGTTEKIVNFEGAAFAGFELEGVRQVKLRLQNTYYNAFSLRAKQYHYPMYKVTSRFFAGIMLNYHTAKGYTKKVALGAGALAADCNTVYPSYAGSLPPDQLIDLGDIINQGPEATFALDLTQYAPPDWDGKLWLSAGSDMVAAGRRLSVQLLAINENAGSQFVKGVDPQHLEKLYHEPRSITIPHESEPPMIDGIADEEIWKAAVAIQQFFPVGGRGVLSQNTQAAMYYDENNLYIQIICQENKRPRPITGVSPIWYNDEVEIWMSPRNDGKSYEQLIINAGGEKLELNQNGTVRFDAKVAAHFEAGRWVVEAAIPFKGLGIAPPKPGDIWGFNICRYRPEDGGNPSETITWAPLERGFNEPENFVSVKFGA